MKSLLCLSLVALLARPAVQDVPAPEERDRVLHAQETADIRRRAADEAEARAAELDALAERLEALASDAAAAATKARESARAARAAAEAARRRSNEAGAALRRANGTVDENGTPVAAPPTLDGARAAAGQPMPVRRGRPIELDKHAAAGRSAAENKSLYLPRMRGSRAAPGGRPATVKSWVFPPGEAPDIGDMELRAQWQWSVNVARGDASFQGPGARQLAKTGNVDIARVSFLPDPGSEASRGMKWGMRRYNLGDSTVTDCDFTGIPKEHGVYDNLAGHGLYRGNTFLNLGGQAIQIAHRDKAYSQYKADNLPFTGKPTLIVEGNHAVDCGLDASRSAFTWTFFDYGTHEFPSTIVMRDCTSVHAWDMTRTTGGDSVPADHPRAVRAPGGVVVHQYQHVKPGAETYAVEAFVVDNCLFDLTQSEMPVMALRGIGSILIEDSCFIARNHRRPVVDIDDQPDRRSGTVVLENCVSPPEHQVWLAIRGQRIRTMHCPGKRITIDVATLEVEESEMMDDPITRLISPLAGREVASGMLPQSPGHVDDIGTVTPTYAGAPASPQGDEAGAEGAPDTSRTDPGR